MITILDGIANTQLRAFAIRAYNTFVATILPITASAILAYIQLHEVNEDISEFLSPELWRYVGYSVIVTLLGSTTAGTAKALRTRN